MSAYNYEMFPVFAILSEDICYYKEDDLGPYELMIPKGTSVQVDVMRHIALIGRDHVQLEEDEYNVVSI